MTLAFEASIMKNRIIAKHLDVLLKVLIYTSIYLSPANPPAYLSPSAQINYGKFWLAHFISLNNEYIVR